ncbi:MAG: DUF6705 family protein [Bacteroidota bacterium]
MNALTHTILLSICLATFSQNPNLTPFVGHWEWQNGNQTFKVEIYQENNYLKGHYQLTEINDGTETTIYDSNK